jgi:hypothetical protein
VEKYGPVPCLEEEEGEGEIPVVVVGLQRNPVAMPLSPPTDDGIDYIDKSGGQRDERRGADNNNKQKEQLMDDANVVRTRPCPVCTCSNNSVDWAASANINFFK